MATSGFSPALVAEATRRVASLRDDSVELNRRFGMGLDWFDTHTHPDDGDLHWDCAVSVGLLDTLKWLMTKDTIVVDCDASTVLTSSLNWITSTLLHGPVRQQGCFAGCNVSRCLQLLVETDGGWDGFLAAVEGNIVRAIRRDLPQNVRSQVNNNTREVLRFINGNLACIEAVGSPIVSHPGFAENSVPVFARMLNILNLPERDAYLDENSAMEGLTNQFIGIFHNYCEQSNVCPNYEQRLGLAATRLYMYRTMGKAVGKKMIVQGGNLGYQEFQAVVSEAQRDPQYRGSSSGSKAVGRNDPCHCGSGKKFKKCCSP
jgi:hypothetical protein